MIRHHLILACSILFLASGVATSSASAKSGSHVARTRLVLLRPREFGRLSKSDKALYFRSLQKILIALEGKRAPHTKDPKNPKHGRKHASAALSLLFSKAFAAKANGGACELGGYFGKWHPDASGALVCDQPDAFQNWESDDDQFYCGTTASGEKKGYCNSAFFLYANDTSERMCEPVSSLSASCAADFETRYMKDPEFPKRLSRDVAHLNEVMGDEELEDYHAKLETYLNSLIAAKDDDAPTAKLLSGLLTTLRKIKQDSAIPGTPLEAAPEPAPAAGESKLLGRELTCVRDGLRSVGFSPSEKYLALIGAGVQAYRGPYRASQDPEALKNLQAAVISTVQAYGFCDESAYPGAALSGLDLSRARSLLTADGGKITASGIEYVGSALGADANSRGKALSDLFGIGAGAGAETDAAARGFAQLFTDEENWSKLTIADRQKLLSGWKGRGDKVQPSAFESCQKNAVGYQNQKGGALDLEALNETNRKASVQDPARRDQMVRVSLENYRLCGVMASSCALDMKQVCQAPGLVGVVEGFTPPGAAPGEQDVQ